MKRPFLLIFINFLFIGLFLHAQPYALQVDIANQPFDVVVVGAVKGDKFIASDSVKTNNSDTGSSFSKSIAWTFPPTAQKGIYRIVFGQTTYARVMNEPPQQLDFIFNGEDIRIKTDFNAPTDSLKVIHSEENLLWFSFLKKEKEYKQKLKEQEMEVDYYHNKLDELSSVSGGDERLTIEGKAAQVANDFNQLQMEREMFITQSFSNNENLFVGRLIKSYREPFRDGYLTEKERNLSYQKEYLKYINFSDEALMNSPVLTDRIFNYLITYNHRGFNHEQRENAYIKAVDAVLQKVEEDTDREGMMYEFVLNYLVDGFEGLKMNKVLKWISDHYDASLCEGEEKTTLRRKLEAHKMSIGEMVPDFTMNDLGGSQVVFSQVLKDQNVLIFWASWCPHCNRLLSQVISLCNRRSNIEVIAVSLDDSANDWKKAVHDLGIEKFRNLSDLKKWDGQVAEDYNIYATPTMFLIDNNLKILAKPTSLAELSKALEKY